MREQDEPAPEAAHPPESGIAEPRAPAFEHLTATGQRDWAALVRENQREFPVVLARLAQ